MKFHEKLYAIRKQEGMTQNTLAEKLNVSRQAVSRWEMGTAMPDVDNLVAMSELFGVSVDYLLKDEVQASQQSVQNEPAEQKETKEVKWLRLALVLFAIGIGLIVNGLYFGTSVSLALVPVGAGMIVLSLVVCIVLFIYSRKTK